MSSVLDSSVAVKCVIPEKDTPKAVRLREEFRRGIRERIAPDIFAGEVVNAIAKCQHNGIITPAIGAKRIASVFRCMPQLHPDLPMLPAAYAIASRYRIAVFDCLYVVLAQREGCDLITADRRLVNALQKDFPFITDLSTRP